jgi:hypothetical protein
MTIENLTIIVTQQGGAASTRPATTGQNPDAMTDAELKKAAEQLKAAFQKSGSQELIRARAQEAAQAATSAALAQSGLPTPPPAPDVPRVFRIQGPDGQTTITMPPAPFRDAIPPQAVDISIAFFITVAAIIIGLPLARAFARRMDRRTSGAQIPSDITSQLSQLNQAVDAIALEVERISEGQRFTSRLLSEQHAASGQTLPSGAAR